MEYCRGSCELCDCNNFIYINKNKRQLCLCNHGDVWHKRLYYCKICNKLNEKICSDCKICKECLNSIINCPIAKIN